MQSNQEGLDRGNVILTCVIFALGLMIMTFVIIAIGIFSGTTVVW